MFRKLLRSWTGWEVWSAAIAITSFLLTILANFRSGARTETLVVLALVASGALLCFVFLITRNAFALRGYSNVMYYLESLAESAKYSIWTARAHMGEGPGEEKYFNIIEHRLAVPSRPLEDFRRIIRLNRKAARHVQWLFTRLHDRPGVEVRYYDGGGPQFDFVIVDQKIAVIGFPMLGGKDNVGAIVMRRRFAVRGVETVFHELWNDSKPLFEGSGSRSGEEIDLLQTRVHSVFGGENAE